MVQAQSHGPTPRSMQNVAALAVRYVGKFEEMPARQAERTLLSRPNPVLHRLRTHQDWYWDDGTALCAAIEKGRVGEAFGAAAREHNTYDAGLCLGFLDPRPECTVGSHEFQRGFRDGQAYLLKCRPAWERQLHRACMITAGLSGLSLASQSVEFSAEMAAWVERSRAPILYTALACFLYGSWTMWRTRLFGRDEFLSERLVTSGAFRFQRNPFYAGMGLGTTVTAMWIGAAHLLAHHPSYGTVATFLTSLTGFLFTYHRNVLRDERVLEKQFGPTYRAYKATTPRYFPAVWKLWARFTRSP